MRLDLRKRARRLALAWENALEIRRAGRLTAPYGAPFETVHEERVWRLRRYESSTRTIAAPILMVPPLMVASEVYDISPDVSAIAYLQRAGADVWLIDFGAPEREEGGMDRTLDDHIRGVSDAISLVREATGHDVHLCGYSQGGMFCYQAAAFRRGDGIASIVTAGSPVDLHRTLRVDEDITERVVASMRGIVNPILERIEGLPGTFTSTGFKLFSARKEVKSLLDFVKNLHDRGALEKREAKRLFLGGEGFVAWPGPAFRKFVDEVIVGNRMVSGGFVVDGHSVTLADLSCPILYFVGSRDEMGKPAAVRGIRGAAPRVEQLYEVVVKAGHFGLVVGSTALTITWPTTIAWMKWREGKGPLPAGLVDSRAPVADHDDDEIASDLVEKTGRAVLERIAELGEDVGAYLDNARYQLPRLNRLRQLQDDTLISPARALAEQAEKIGDRTFFLFRGRAFTYAESNRRVDAVVRGLIACGIRPGQRVGVMMKSRPSHLSLVTALNRLGAVAVLFSPDTPDEQLARVVELGEAELVIVDPDGATRTRAAIAGQVLVLGGVGEVPWQPGTPHILPPGVVDMEAIDPEAVALPAWYKPDAGRARDLAMVFVSSGRYEPPRATRITNRRWAFSALGAAAAAMLTTRDTVYCCLPLHHPSGTLVATGSALVSGARLALASKFDAQTFWDEVRRYGASIVYYAGEMCRRLLDAPPVVGESNNPVRLFAGSGLRADAWRRLVERFGPVGVCELYASTEAHVVLANASGKRIGSVGRPLPGSPEVAVAAMSGDELMRDGRGHLIHARLDEPGMLVARLSARAGADIAHIDPRRLQRDAFEPGDTWFATGDLFRVDAAGDYWFVGRHQIQTEHGPVTTTRIEDALYAVRGVQLCVATADPDDPAHAAAVVQGSVAIDAISAAVAALPEYARPHRLRIVDSIPMTDGFRPLRHAVDLAGAYEWNARAQRYVAPTQVRSA